MTTAIRFLFLIAFLMCMSTLGASAEQAPADPPEAAEPPAATAGAATTAAQDDDPDLDVNLAQPDFTLVGLPTTLRLARHRGAFRITHRFARPLGQGDFVDLVEDFFGFDSSAQIGFEYRFGLFRATQLAVHRNNNRTIQFLLQRQIVGQDEDFPLSIDAIASIEGTDNFTESYSPALGVLVSREFGDRAAVYAEPIWVNNSNAEPSELVDDNSSFVLGLGTRVRLASTFYGVFEYTPRVAGYEPGEHQFALAIEKRLGGHSFQINFGNAFGTTFAQMARGGYRRVVHRLQHLAEVLLTDGRGARHAHSIEVMHMRGTWMAAVVVGAVLATAVACGGGGDSNPTAPTDGGGTGGTGGGGGSVATNTITIGADGRVSPASITIAVGSRVTFVNNHNQNHDMASDPHPSHEDCPPMDQVGFMTPGQSRTSGNFTAVRRCGFHDHNEPSNSALVGSITVQ